MVAMSDPPPILAYAPPEEGGARPVPLALRLTSLAGSVCAAVAVFVPFAWRTSPAEVLMELTDWPVRPGEVNLVLLAAPFVAGIVAAAANVRRAIWPTALRAWERAALGVVGAAAGGATLVLGLRCLADGDVSTWETFQILTGPVVVGVAVALVVWLAYRRRHDAAAMIALYAGFCGNAVTALVAFRSDRPELGWSLTLVATTVMFAEAVWILAGASRAPSNAPRGVSG
jgi:hypothetical protein